MKRCLLVFLFVVFTLLSYSQKDIKFERISIEQGLSQSTVTCVFKDSRGFMWFGTEDGLNLYDGYEFKIFKPIPGDSTSISNNTIRVIYEDSNGDVWIGTNVGLDKYCYKTGAIERYLADGKNGSLNNDNVRSVFQSKNGTLWIGTLGGGLNEFDYEKESFKHHVYPAPDSIQQLYNDIRSIYEDEEGYLWLASYGGGLQRYNPQTDEYRVYRFQEEDSFSVNSSFTRQILVSKHGDFYVLTDRGLSTFDKLSGEFFTYKSDTANTTSIKNILPIGITEDLKGNIWIGYDGEGIDKLIPEKGKFLNYHNKPTNPNSLSNDVVRFVYCDYSGVLWVGTFGGGVCKYDMSREKFTHYPPNPNDLNAVSHKYVWAFYEDDEENIWIGTDRGLDKFDRKTESFKNYPANPEDTNSLSNKRVWGICGGKTGFLWVATKNGLNRFNTKTEQFERFFHDPDDKNTLNNNHARRVLYDKNGQLWIALWNGGLDKYNPETGKFTHHVIDVDDPYSINHNSIWALLEDKDGNIWTGGYNGGLCMRNKETGRFDVYMNNPEDTTSLSNNMIAALYQDSKDRLWIGTRGSGLDLFIPQTKSFKHYTIADGLPNGVIYGILEDDKGFLWLSTNNGLSKFDPENKTFENFTEEDGLQSFEFNGGAAYKCKSGEMLFGGIWGFNIFTPDSIIKDTVVPPVVITDLKILNNSVPIGKEFKGRVILKKDISQTNLIELTYQDYVFSFDFATLNFNMSDKIKYAYKLEGFEDQWNYTGHKRRFASYTNLDAGTYTFRVKGTNADGIWSEEGASVKIIIHPPFWETWWFRITAFVLIVGFVFNYYRSRIKRIERQKIELERQVMERTEEIRKKNLVLEEQKEKIEKSANELQTANSELKDRQQEIETQAERLRIQAGMLQETNQALEKEKEHTIGSIRYARTIQAAILPQKSQLDKFFENFIIYKPKDIVSGDFYWFSHFEANENQSETMFFAVVDCTGHGVPGAFMTMIGSRLLNLIVNERLVHSPKEILTRLDKEVIAALNQDKTDNDDGMDLCLCKLERVNGSQMKVTFCGAKRPLFYYQKEKESLMKLNGNRKSIGGIKTMRNKVNFTNQQITLNKGDIIYLSTDGIIDQNATNRKRFSTKRLVEIIQNSANLPLKKQGDLLNTELEKYMKDVPQRDDIAIAGLRV